MITEQNEIIQTKQQTSNRFSLVYYVRFMLHAISHDPVLDITL